MSESKRKELHAKFVSETLPSRSKQQYDRWYQRFVAFAEEDGVETEQLKVRRFFCAFEQPRLLIGQFVERSRSAV